MTRRLDLSVRLAEDVQEAAELGLVVAQVPYDGTWPFLTVERSCGELEAFRMAYKLARKAVKPPLALRAARVTSGIMLVLLIVLGCLLFSHPIAHDEPMPAHIVGVTLVAAALLCTSVVLFLTALTVEVDMNAAAAAANAAIEPMRMTFADRGYAVLAVAEEEEMHLRLLRLPETPVVMLEYTYSFGAGWEALACEEFPAPAKAALEAAKQHARLPVPLPERLWKAATGGFLLGVAGSLPALFLPVPNFVVPVVVSVACLAVLLAVLAESMCVHVDLKGQAECANELLEGHNLQLDGQRLQAVVDGKMLRLQLLRAAEPGLPLTVTVEE